MVDLAAGLHDAGHGADQELAADGVASGDARHAEIGRQPVAQPLGAVPFQALEPVQDGVKAALVGDALDGLASDAGADQDADRRRSAATRLRRGRQTRSKAGSADRPRQRAAHEGAAVEFVIGELAGERPGARAGRRRHCTGSCAACRPRSWPSPSRQSPVGALRSAAASAKSSTLMLKALCAAFRARRWSPACASVRPPRAAGGI